MRSANEEFVPPVKLTVNLQSDLAFSFGAKAAFGMTFCDPSQFSPAFGAEGLCGLVEGKADALVRD